jgi:phytoene/squalene synthetase
MSTSSEVLARSITRSANGHADATIRFLVDRPRIGDAFRAYAYFRWVDDRLDLGDLDRSQAQTFLERQRALIAAAYRGQAVPGADPQEEILLDLVRHDPQPDSGLAVYIHRMMEVMAFDAERRGRLVSAEELASYTRALAVAVMETLHYFIGHDDKSPRSPSRYLAAAGAHIAHMLRDTHEDIARGYFNIPREVLQEGGISPEQIDSPAYRAWVRQRVLRSRRCLRLGRAYLAQVESLRCRIACLAYCLRFEACLDSIERNACVLRQRDPAARGPGSAATFLAAASLAVRRTHRPVPAFAWRHRGSRAEDPAGYGQA